MKERNNGGCRLIPEIRALVNERTPLPMVIAKLGLGDDDDGWDEIVNAIDDPASWMEEQDYLMTIRSDR